MMGRHETDCRFRKDPLTLIGAPVQQHLGKTGIIRDRGDQTGPAGFEAGFLLHGVLDRQMREGIDLVRLSVDVDFGKAPLFGLGHVETGILHPQRVEDPLLQERAEALAAHDLYDRAKDIRGSPVHELGARLEHERAGAQALRHLHRSDLLRGPQLRDGLIEDLLRITDAEQGDEILRHRPDRWSSTEGPGSPPDAPRAQGPPLSRRSAPGNS